MNRPEFVVFSRDGVGEKIKSNPAIFLERFLSTTRKGSAYDYVRRAAEELIGEGKTQVDARRRAFVLGGEVAIYGYGQSDVDAELAKAVLSLFSLQNVPKDMEEDEMQRIAALGLKCPNTLQVVEAVAGRIPPELVGARINTEIFNGAGFTLSGLTICHTAYVNAQIQREFGVQATEDIDWHRALNLPQL